MHLSIGSLPSVAWTMALFSVRVQHIHGGGDAAPRPHARGRQALQVPCVRLLVHPARSARASHGQALDQRVWHLRENNKLQRQVTILVLEQNGMFQVGVQHLYLLYLYVWRPLPRPLLGQSTLWWYKRKEWPYPITRSSMTQQSTPGVALTKRVNCKSCALFYESTSNSLP